MIPKRVGPFAYSVLSLGGVRHVHVERLRSRRNGDTKSVLDEPSVPVDVSSTPTVPTVSMPACQPMPTSVPTPVVTEPVMPTSVSPVSSPVPLSVGVPGDETLTESCGAITGVSTSYVSTNPFTSCSTSAN